MDIGFSAIAVALIATIISFILFIYYTRKQDESVYNLSRTALYAQTLLLTAAVVILLYYFLARDFNVEYVALYSDSSLPLAYTLGALWGGASGSLLLWAWILSLFMMYIVLNERKDKITGYTLAVLLSVNIFLMALLLTMNNPFHRLTFIPEDGAGLSPLLINPGMLIHPPILFIGYAGLTIPFAYAIAGLLSKNEIWIFRVRKYSLFSWLFLGFGIFLGGWWSYTVLGWGGYWAWDPVENASLVPWLISSTFLHSIMLQESRRGMKLWNVILSIAAFETVFLATFITRSGIISSVHAFGSSAVGPIFAGYIVLTLLVSLGILAFRFDQVKSMNIFKSVTGRETSFLFNNLFFVVMALTILWGTLFPMLNEAVVGTKISVGPGFYNAIAPYVMLSLVVLMGLCVILRWGTTSSAELIHKLKYPLGIGLISILIAYYLGFTEISSLIGFSAAIFAIFLHLEDYWFDVKDFTKKTEKKVFRSMLHILITRRRRYGGYIVHLSMFLMFFGIIGSSIYQTNYSTTLQTNMPQEIGGYTFTYTGFLETEERMSNNLNINILVNKGNFADNVTPIVSENLKTQSIYVNVGVLSLPFEDIYVIPEAVSQDQVSITINYVPLISLLWYGGILMIIGVIIGLLPKSLVERKKIE
ncbi:heme lyase CcmF/NrfE family subunit [Thermoproteota archaeon]